MSPFVIVTATMLAIVHYDIRPKLHGDKKVLWISIAFLALGYITLALACFDILLPSPLRPVEDLIRRLFEI